MSLIIDILKKLEGKTKRTRVHPALLRRTAGVQDRKRYVFLGLSILFALSALGAYFVSDLILSRAVQQDMGIERIVASVRVPEQEASEPEPIPQEEELPEEEVPEPTIVREAQTRTLPVEEKSEPEEVVAERKQEPEPVRVSKSTGVEKMVSDIVPEPVEEETVPEQEAREEEPEPTPTSPPPEPEPRKKPPPRESFSKLAYLADKSFRSGKLIDSMRYYEEALSVKEDIKVANNLVVVYVRLGLYEKARDLISRMGSEKLAYTYLIELSRSGDTERAIREGEELKGLDARGKVLFALGYAYELEGDILKALEHYRKAYRKNPGDPYIAVNYARLLEAMGNLREAYRVYRGLNFTGLDPKLKSLVEERLSHLRSLGF